MRNPKLIVASLAVAFALTACGGSNAGGDTTCGDYLEMSSSEQGDVIRSFLDSKGDSDPASGTVSLNRLSALGFCNTIGKASDPIRKIDG